MALVSAPRDWGGGESQAHLLACGLRRLNHHVTAFAQEDGVLAQRLRAAGIDVIGFRGRGRTPAAMWQIRRALRQMHPDVLYFNDSHALTAAGWASIGLHIPVRIATRRVSFPLRSPWNYRLLADRVICVSRAAADMAVRGGIPAAQIRVVPDGVDPASVACGNRDRGRNTLGLTADQRLLLTVAKLTDCKGHAYLLDALPAVLQRHPQLVVALAGGGELAEPLRAQATRLGIDSRVRFLGFRHDVPDLIQACDLFVLPSHTEGMCSTLIDVMFAGRPIVTTTAGGIADLTGWDEPGTEPVAWCVAPRDASALTQAILAALASPARCAERVQRARERAEQRFTADRMVETTLEVCGECLPAPSA